YVNESNSLDEGFGTPHCGAPAEDLAAPKPRTPTSSLRYRVVDSPWLHCASYCCFSRFDSQLGLHQTAAQTADSTGSGDRQPGGQEGYARSYPCYRQCPAVLDCVGQVDDQRPDSQG